MSTTSQAPSVSTLRGEIEKALYAGGRGGIRISATAKYLAHQLNAPVRRVREELEMGAREGSLTTRRLKSGEVLFKLVDVHHSRWAQLGHQLTIPR